MCYCFFLIGTYSLSKLWLCCQLLLRNLISDISLLFLCRRMQHLLPPLICSLIMVCLFISDKNKINQTQFPCKSCSKMTNLQYNQVSIRVYVFDILQKDSFTSGQSASCYTIYLYPDMIVIQSPQAQCGIL